MKKKWLKWAATVAITLTGLGLGTVVLVIVYRTLPRWLFWIAVFFYVKAVLGGIVRLWMTRPGYQEKEQCERPEWHLPLPQAPRRHCPLCGQAVAGDDRCCRYCGAQLEDSKLYQNSSDEKPPVAKKESDE
ncbi:MAG: zinc ribbon domain-containing protein [Pygmaiobacter massiliensis]